jgi:hypothetical protein
MCLEMQRKRFEHSLRDRENSWHAALPPPWVLA